MHRIYDSFFKGGKKEKRTKSPGVVLFLEVVRIPQIADRMQDGIMFPFLRL